MTDASQLGVSTGLTSGLMSILDAPDIVPGSEPSYQTCKDLYIYHPLGGKLAEKPVRMAQSQARVIEIPGAPQDDLIEAYQREWKALGEVGADVLIRNAVVMSRVYGLASVAVLCDEIPTSDPLPSERIHELDLYFNILDPLNTAGSLVLEQDPNRPNFMKPSAVKVSGQAYHASRTAVVMNEQPIYIAYTSSAFGFVGRSVYQRCLYPMKSYIQSMVTDNAVTEKAALLVAKLQAPGAIIDQRARNFFSFKRDQIGGGKTGNVLSVGIQESVESLDLKNVKDAASFARDNILKNIASANNMPASMINDETLAEGFGEGSEDAKQIARYVDSVRMEMDPLYKWFDNIVMRRAWSPAFYETMKVKYPELKKVEYTTAFFEWKNAFTAVWPNLLDVPDNEKMKGEDVVMKSAIALFEVLAPVLDPENKATTANWLSDVANSRKLMYGATPLILDPDLIAAYEPPAPEFGAEKEPKPIVESGHE